MTGPTGITVDGNHRARSGNLLVAILVLSLCATGCEREEPLVGAKELDQARCDFSIYWPPKAPEDALAESAKPLLIGNVALDADAQPSGETALRLVVTLQRPSAEADREHWNSALAFADIAWMNEVRVWDAEEKWLWPNLPYLLRLPGRERVERYGGMDPGKHVDNDFAAVLIRKYDARGVVESAETKDSPLVSAEWHPVDAAGADLYSIVHTARSDAFLLHLGGKDGPPRGRFKVWLIYADFLRASAPRKWPATREFAGGILAYFEIDWEALPGKSCRGIVRPMRPQQSTGFRWADWVVRRPGSHETEAQVRLSDKMNDPH